MDNIQLQTTLRIWSNTSNEEKYLDSYIVDTSLAAKHPTERQFSASSYPLYERDKFSRRSRHELANAALNEVQRCTLVWRMADFNPHAQDR